MKLRDKWRRTTIGRSARVFSRRDQKRIIAVVLLQISLGFLDLLGVAAIGILGALSVSGIQSGTPGNRVNSALRILHISEFSFQTQVAIIGLGAATLLIGRTIFSIFFTRRTLLFLSRRGAQISTDLVSKLLSQSLLGIQSRTNQRALYSVTHGVTIVTNGILGTAVLLVADGSLLLVMSFGLFAVDPIVAAGTFIVFAFVGYLMYRLMNVRAKALGKKNWELSIKGDERIVEAMNSYRELVVRNRRSYYAREISKVRFELADVLAEIQFMPNMSKDVIESTVILGSLLISAAQFTLQDSKHAVATLAVFLAAGTRVAPAVMRIQQGAISIRNNIGSAGPTLELIETLANADGVPDAGDILDLNHKDFNSNVVISELIFKYPNAIAPALNGINLDIKSGQSVAIVGPSGAGKTTLVDILLGVLNPDSGSVKISGIAPLAAISKWSGAMAYVPQDVIISNGSIRGNVALGFPLGVGTDDLVNGALEIANLREFAQSLELGIDTQVGERGTKISGGQRQRLGIARAMFTNPKLLVLDEATSSLDGLTEAAISEAVLGLKGSVTVIMIAHRLSTVRGADLVVYMESGRIIATGTFEEVRNQVPDFDNQAKLMGL
ncbi:MAG: ABC transporter ATP-binding protein [Chloroflexales bacterium]|nr:ABC transporter ATP-binding protein [Chloroflexales bacterium]